MSDPLLVNNFQESVQTKTILETTTMMQRLIDEDRKRTEFCNLLINKIEYALQTKEGLNGNTCIFSMRSPLYEDFVGHKVYSADSDLDVRDILNQCFPVHRELAHFKVISVSTYDEHTLPINPCSDECGPMCGLCICCPCLFPFYCISVNLIRGYCGKNITYKIQLELKDTNNKNTENVNVSIGVPLEQTFETVFAKPYHKSTQS